MSSRWQLSPTAQADLDDILTWSVENFGDQAADRYATLILSALADIAFDSRRPGAVLREDWGSGLISWHLQGSRAHAGVAGGRARRPRHLAVYRLSGEVIEVLAFIHEREAPDATSRRPTRQRSRKPLLRGRLVGASAALTGGGRRRWSSAGFCTVPARTASSVRTDAPPSGWRAGHRRVGGARTGAAASPAPSPARRWRVRWRGAGCSGPGPVGASSWRA
ncbi:hypothetical protein GCM10027062_16740 [Nocardioides hungaricus]